MRKAVITRSVLQVALALGLAGCSQLQQTPPGAGTGRGGKSDRNGAKDDSCLKEVEVAFDASSLDDNTKDTLRTLGQAALLIGNLSAKMRQPGVLYPADATAAEITAFLAAHPEQQCPCHGARSAQGQISIASLYTVVQRGANGLVAVPYSQAFAEDLRAIGTLMQKAADTTPDAALKAYLLAQINSFGTDDYSGAHRAWRDMAGTSRYEVLGSFLLVDSTSDNAGNAFPEKEFPDMVLGLQDQALTATFDATSQYQMQLDDNLPLAAGLDRWPPQLNKAPMVAYQEVVEVLDVPLFEAMTLPDDPDLHALGFRKDFAMNVMAANLMALVGPATEQVLVPEQAALVDLDSIAMHVNLHELGHSIGPTTAKVNSQEIPFDQIFTNFFLIEEPKAESVAVLNADKLMDLGALPASAREKMYATAVANYFRFGRAPDSIVLSPGDRSNINLLTERGALMYDPASKRWRINFAAFGEAVRQNAQDWISLERAGDAAAADKFLQDHAQITPEMQEAFDRIGAAGIPAVDGLTGHWNGLDQLGLAQPPDHMGTCGN